MSDDTPGPSTDNTSNNESENGGSKKEEEKNSSDENEGVKISNEVFSKDLPATNEVVQSEKSDEPKSTPTEASKETAKPAGETASGPAVPIGPSVPTDSDYDPEELKKAEEHKAKGNEFFKGKY